jgi:hypothetical protein
MSLMWHISPADLTPRTAYWPTVGPDSIATPRAPCAPSRLLSRRAVFTLGAAVVSGLAAGWSQSVQAAPTVTVEAPTIVPKEYCTAIVSVRITIADVASDVRYEVYGDLMESDEPDGDPDLCCPLNPQATPPGVAPPHRLLLTRQAMVADLGLVRGLGPASDESYSPEFVELFARIWIRDLTSDDHYGPWESPLRVAAASGALDWTHLGPFPGSELLVPRGRPSLPIDTGVGVPLPPQACLT